MNSRSIYLPFDVTLVPGRILNSGNLTCLYESGRIRYLTFNDRQLLRLIYTAVRDKDWDTATISIADESVQQNENGFRISYTAAYYYQETVFEATVEVIAEGNTLTFSFKGKSTKSFLRNRIGICVLHPIQECSGKSLSITEPDGGNYTAVFPETVSPHQPAKNIGQMVWPVDDEYNAVLKFHGDIFEMEDQRNWTDDSYKTYSTPVDLPLPVQIEPGEIVDQSVNLWFEPLNEYSMPQPLAEHPQKIPMPLIGYSRVAGHPPSVAEIALLQQLPFNHYRAEIAMDSGEWEKELRQAVDEARLIGTKLELVLMMSAPVLNVGDVISAHVNYLDSVIIVDAGNGKPVPELFEFAISSLGSLRPSIRIGYGTNNHFADLNRFPPANGGYDFLSFGISPQAHAGDTRTVIENLAAQPATVERVKKAIDESALLHISTLTLKPRVRNSGHSLTPQDDRFASDFLVFWTLAALSGLEVKQVTLYDAVGASGVLYNGDASSLFTALKEIKEFGARWIRSAFEEAKPAVIFINDAGDELRFETDRAFFDAVRGNSNHG